MSDTPGTPHLLTDVRFSVSRKGYDPDEVDNFLERVSGAVGQLQEKLRKATAAAEAAEARAADAGRNEARLQARIAELEAGNRTAPVVPIRETDLAAEAEQSSTVLMMAQRTAEAAVAEARANAAQLLSDAEREAASILAAARARADEELQGLDRIRREMAADNAALEAFMAEQRAQIAAGLARIHAVLDDPAALRTGTPPVAMDRPATRPTAPAAPAPAASAAPAPAAPPAAVPGSTPEPEVFQPVLASSDWQPPTPDAGGGPATAALPSIDDEFLAEDDADADAAMRRFFDADFDDRR
jgi:DivIVA domain-containing protein